MDKKNSNQRNNQNIIDKLSKEINIESYKIEKCCSKFSIDLKDPYFIKRYLLVKDVVCSYYGVLDSYIRSDENRIELDNEIKRYDEIYVDTAPIIHEDWFLFFIANVIPHLRRRRKKLVVLEKTMEEMYGISHNEEKDFEVRLRAKVRPYLLQDLAKKGFLRKIDTGSKGIADDHLINILRRRGKTHNILLITQDRYLSERVVEVGENLNKNIEIPHHTPFDRIIHWKKVDEDIVKKVVVCELLKNGDLLRLYICQHCGDSYYDKLYDCGGFVLCSSCYYEIEEKKQKFKVKKELQDKKRLKELKEIEEKRDLEENINTVGNLIKKKQQRFTLIVIIILVILTLVSYFLI
ncbi:MAG: hypothetical protein ACPKM0_00525 [Pleomorphochaeta sp.]